MKKTIPFILIVLFWSCKENADSGNKIIDERPIDTVVKVDYHKMIDVVLDTFEIHHDKIIHVQYEPTKNAIDGSRRNNLLNNSGLSEEEKRLAIQLLETEKDSFNFRRIKLNQHSQEILENTGKTTDQNLTYYFRSFLSDEKNDLVVSTIGAIMNNESYSTKNSGAELIMFFKKGEDDQWKVSNFISTIEY